MKPHEVARRILAVSFEQLQARQTSPEALANVRESMDLLDFAIVPAVEIIRWQTSGFPDDEATVLMELDFDPPAVEAGFREAGRWHHVNGASVDCAVLAWANYPAGLSVRKERP